MGALSAAIRLEGEKKARKEDAARVTKRLLVEGYSRDEVASMLREIWNEFTEEDVLAAVRSVAGI